MVMFARNPFGGQLALGQLTQVAIVAGDWDALPAHGASLPALDGPTGYLQGRASSAWVKFQRAARRSQSSAIRIRELPEAGQLGKRYPGGIVAQCPDRQPGPVGRYAAVPV
jgi:hypothetical protein